MTMDLKLGTKLGSIKDDLAESVVRGCVEQLDVMIEEAEFELDLDDAASLERYIEVVGNLIEDPELDEGLRAGFKMVFGRLVKAGKALGAKAKKAVGHFKKPRRKQPEPEPRKHVQLWRPRALRTL